MLYNLATHVHCTSFVLKLDERSEETASVGETESGEITGSPSGSAVRQPQYMYQK